MTDKKTEKVVTHRDSKSGEYVTKKYADTHKSTTQRETRKK